MKQSSTQGNSLSSGSKQFNTQRKFLKLTIFTRLFPLQACISYRDCWLLRQKTAWRRSRPIEIPEKDILQPVELPVGCSVYSMFPVFVSCHPYWGELWWHSFLNVFVPLSNFSEFIGSEGGILVVTLLWSVTDPLSRVCTCLLTSPRNSVT